MKNLLVAFNGSEGSIAALRYAASLAERSGAHVTAMMAHSAHEVIDKRSRWIPKEARALLDAANSSILREIEAKFEAERTALGLVNALQLKEVTAVSTPSCPRPRGIMTCSSWAAIQTPTMNM